jgi:hypothetical protein
MRGKLGKNTKLWKENSKGMETLREKKVKTWKENK